MPAEVSPDLAQKALQADVRNTLQNVAQGDTLPAGKRQLFMDVVMGDARPQEITDARRTALLRRFAAGGRLRKEELDEIADIVPVNPAASGRKGGYRKTFDEYGTIYGKKKRTVIWWVEQGEKHKLAELPPLDAPRFMPAWWGRIMKQRCPDSVLSAARADHAVHQGEASPPPPATNGTTPAPPSSPRTPVSQIPGFEGNLRNLQQQVAIAYQELVDAQAEEPRDPAKIEQARRRWMQLDAAAQKAEAAAPDIFEKTGRLVDKEALAQVLTTMLTAIANSIRSLRRRLKSQLTTAVDEAEEDAIWQRGIDETFEEMQRSGYAEPFHLNG